MPSVFPERVKGLKITRKLTISIVCLVLSLAFCVWAVLAWFAANSEADAAGMNISVSSDDLGIGLLVIGKGLLLGDKFTGRDVADGKDALLDLCKLLFPDRVVQKEHRLIFLLQTLQIEVDIQINQPKIPQISSFLGFFGADAFYLGFKKLGILRLLINLIIYAAASLILFFLTELSFYSFIIPFGALFVIYFIIGIINLFIRGKKDVNGVCIR